MDARNYVVDVAARINQQGVLVQGLALTGDIAKPSHKPRRASTQT